MMHGIGFSGGMWSGSWVLVSLAFWVGIVLLAVWFYRYLKDSPENKRLLAWALGLIVGASILGSLSFWGMGGMMGGWMNSREFRDLMIEHMREEFQER